MPPAGSPLRRDVRRACTRPPALRPPTDLIETVSIVATLALLQSSDAVSLLPEGLARHYEAPGMLARLAVPLPGAGTRYEVMTRTSRELAPAAQAFVDAVLAIAKRQGARGVTPARREPVAQRRDRRRTIASTSPNARRACACASWRSCALIGSSSRRCIRSAYGERRTVGIVGLRGERAAG